MMLPPPAYCGALPEQLFDLQNIEQDVARAVRALLRSRATGFMLNPRPYGLTARFRFTHIFIHKV